MNLQKRIKAMAGLGSQMNSRAEAGDEAFEVLCRQAYLKNNWFTRGNIEQALLAWAGQLTEEKITNWLSEYSIVNETTEKRVGVINAGNIPLVGLHDMVSVLLCGHRYTGKNSSEDNLLLPYFASLLEEIEPGFKERIEFVDRLTEFDAVIATGSNNSARYFESYFAKVPHIIRKNRSAVAVLTGNERSGDFGKLGMDIFQYFGMGCRNVSKMFVPKGYDFKNFFEGIYEFNDVMQHSKYMNNFDYNNAMLLMKLVPFLQNGFLIIHEDDRVASPIAVVHYEMYADKNELVKKLDAAEDQIQCLVTNEKLDLKSALKTRQVGFGKAQSPALNEYADGVDTIAFLSSL